MSQLIPIIRSIDPSVKNKALDEFCKNASLSTLLNEAKELKHKIKVIDTSSNKSK